MAGTARTEVIELRFARVKFRIPLDSGAGNLARSVDDAGARAGGLGTPWFDSSIIATVKPAPVDRRVPHTFADVPLNARRLIASQIVTARQEYQG
jgi:hypothetical protein